MENLKCLPCDPSLETIYQLIPTLWDFAVATFCFCFLTAWQPKGSDSPNMEFQGFAGHPFFFKCPFCSRLFKECAAVLFMIACHSKGDYISYLDFKLGEMLISHNSEVENEDQI